MKEFISKRKKMFMLIGIITLIIIVAILILISTPVVNKLNMNRLKKLAYKIIENGELYYSENQIKLGVKDLTLQLSSSKDILKLKDEIPNGKLVVTQDNKTALFMYNDKYCVTKSIDEDDVNISEDYETCEMPKTPISELNSNISSENECIKYNEACENGTLVTVKVNDTETYNFYVISDTGSELTLIMDKNLDSTVPWISESDYTNSGGTNYGSFGNNEKGPITVLNTLKTLTDNWTNVSEKEYKVSGIGNDGNTKIYEDIVMNMKARILTYQEAINLGCTMKSTSCPDYLYSNLSGSNTSNSASGYWTSTGNVSNSNIAWYMNCSGNIYNNVYLGLDSGRGIRPVITIEK